MKETQKKLSKLHIALKGVRIFKTTIPREIEEQARILNVVNELIASGENVNSLDEHGNTPLHIAVKLRYNGSDVVKALIAAGANVESVNEYGDTPLHVALKEKEGLSQVLFIVNELITAGANVNALDARGDTPLHMAVKHKVDLDILRGRDFPVDILVVDALIGSGADVNYRDNDEFTPLMLAVERQDLGMAKALIDHGASILLATHNRGGESPISIAARKDPNSEMYTYLTELYRVQYQLHFTNQAFTPENYNKISEELFSGNKLNFTTQDIDNRARIAISSLSRRGLKSSDQGMHR